MDNFSSLDKKIKLLQEKAINQKSYFICERNIFNKEIGKIYEEINRLEIILSRINNDLMEEKASEFNLDIKSLHIFCFIFTESVIYLLRIFFPKATNIKFNSIGKFLDSISKHKNEQIGHFSDFIDKKLINIEKINNNLRDYRGLINHEKRSTCEWTIRDNLDPMSQSRVISVPWSEDKEFKETSSLSPSQCVELVVSEVGAIIDYLINIVDC